MIFFFFFCLVCYKRDIYIYIYIDCDCSITNEVEIAHVKLQNLHKKGGKKKKKIQFLILSQHVLI